MKFYKEAYESENTPRTIVWENWSDSLRTGLRKKYTEEISPPIEITSTLVIFIFRSFNDSNTSIFKKIFLELLV